MEKEQEYEMPEFDSFWENAWEWTVQKLHDIGDVIEEVVEDDTDYES